MLRGYFDLVLSFAYASAHNHKLPHLPRWADLHLIKTNSRGQVCGVKLKAMRARALLFMEHVRDDNSRFWRTAQDMLNPIWRRLLGAGCNVNRRTRQVIEEAGFHIETLDKAPTGPLTSPTIYGVARPIS